MITIARTFEPFAIKTLVKDDYDFIREDGIPGWDEWLPDLAYTNYYLIPFVDGNPAGLMTFKFISPILAECHLLVKKEFRGKESYLLGIEALNWMKNHSFAKKFIGFVPSDRSLAKLFGKRCGFKEIGILKKSFQRKGNLIDLTIMERD